MTNYKNDLFRIFPPLRSFRASKFSLKSEADFLSKLSLYLGSSLSLSEALSIIENQAESKSKKETFASWRLVVENGKTLAQAFQTEGTMKVSELSKYSVELGERGASLSDSLKVASLQIRKLLALRKKIASAVAYPLTILFGTVGLVLGLLLFVFPKIIPLFDSMKVKLPLSTRLLIGFSRVLSDYWLLIIVFGLLLTVSVFLLFRFSRSFQSFFDRFVMRIPVVGQVVRGRIITSSFDSLHTLLRGGEQLSTALNIVAGTVKSKQYLDAYKKAGREVEQGRSFADFLRSEPRLFPQYSHGIMFAGERTGGIENSVRDIAVVAEEELDDRLKILTAALEPVLMVSMSLIIGFIALSIILPIYGITSHFQSA